MQASSTQYTVVGAGGIGCAVGYALRAAGAAVTFVEADPEKIRWGQRHGVGVHGHPLLSADFIPFEDWQPLPGTMVLLCTKCYNNAAVLSRLEPAISLIPIQNGFDPALEQRPLPLEGIASFVSECFPGQTRTRITRRGWLHLGQRRPGIKDAVPLLAELLKEPALFPVKVVADILPFKYTKLMYNAAISPLAAATGIDNGQLLFLPAARRLFFRLLRENYAILTGAGIRLGKVGPFHPDTVARILSRRWLASALAWVFYPGLRGTYCSMSGDLPDGPTEIDHYNGHLIELAGDRPCPMNRRVYQLVKRMEQEHLSPGLHVLDELARDEEPVCLARETRP
jgi:2-dehydropantoate 2-reductase